MVRLERSLNHWPVSIHATCYAECWSGDTQTLNIQNLLVCYLVWAPVLCEGERRGGDEVETPGHAGYNI